MRVITGTHKGRSLITANGMDVRPTSEKVKEAMFSAVQFQIENAVVLDLFAGSGQLGIEALSRGAKSAAFVDSKTDSINIIKQNLSNCELTQNAKVLCMPSGAFLKSATEKYDIAILDPPYDRKLIQQSLPKLANIMNENSYIICEHENPCSLPETVGEFYIKKKYKYGKIGMTIYTNQKTETD